MYSHQLCFAHGLHLAVLDALYKSDVFVTFTRDIAVPDDADHLDWEEGSVEQKKYYGEFADGLIKERIVDTNEITED